MKIPQRSKSGCGAVCGRLLIGLLAALLPSGFAQNDRGPVKASGTRDNRQSPDAIDRAVEEDPLAREARQRLRLLDEHGQIPPNALIKAYQQKKTMSFRPEAWIEFASRSRERDTAGISRGIWSSIGPNNIGGRTRSIVIHPTNPSIMWFGAVTGGIWKTSDGGSSWNPLDDFLPNLGVSCLAIDPVNPNVLYAGTGELTYSGGAGIFKTTDGGTTWTQLNCPFNYVHRIAISPVNNQIIVVATYWGIYRSTNAGQTWTKVLDAGSGTPYDSIEDVTFHPTDGTKLIAGTWAKVLYSMDSGQTWTIASGVPSTFTGRAEVAYARSNPAIVYANISTNGLRIYRSSDGGHTFTAMGALIDTSGGADGGYNGYADALWVDPTNADVLVAGGVHLYRSTDGGSSLAEIGDGYLVSDLPHPDQHVIVSDPNYNGSTNRVVFFGDDGGIFKTSDILTATLRTGFTNLNHNLVTTQFYGAAGNASSGTIVGGTQDNGTERYRPQDGSNAWTYFIGGDGGRCAADQTDPNYFYGHDGGLERSSDGGGAAYAIQHGINDSSGINRFVLDPNNADTFLAGGSILWRSTNIKASTPVWTAIKPAVSGSSSVSALVVAPGDSNLVWVGYDNGQVWYTTGGTDATPAWTRADLGSPNLPARQCTRITVDPQNSSTVYVTFGGYSPDNVWRTTNYGANWTNISNGLPSAPVDSLIVSPSNSSILYIGTVVGVFATSDGGASWSASNDGPANVEVSELFWMGPSLVAATYGRGMFTATPPPPSPPTVLTVAAGSVGPTTAVLNGKITDDGGASIDHRLFYYWSDPDQLLSVSDAGISVLGNNFSAQVSGLTPGVTYYFGAYGHNSSAMDVAYGVGWGYGGTQSFTTTFPVAATPTISPRSGTFRRSVTVSIHEVTTGATIYYTTNGTAPTTAAKRYTSPFRLSGRGIKTIKAKAVESGYIDSAVATAKLKIL